MSEPPRQRQRGKAWVLLLVLPPLLVLAGLIAVLVLWGSRGGITPKWKKPEVTNATPASGQTR